MKALTSSFSVLVFEIFVLSMMEYSVIPSLIICIIGRFEWMDLLRCKHSAYKLEIEHGGWIDATLPKELVWENIQDFFKGAS